MRYVRDDRLNFALRELIRRNLFAAAIAFGSPSATSCSSIQHLPLEIIEFEKIAVDDPHKANAGADERFGDDRPKRAAPANERASTRQPALPLFAKRCKPRLAIVSGYWTTRSFLVSSGARGQIDRPPRRESPQADLP